MLNVPTSGPLDCAVEAFLVRKLNVPTAVRFARLKFVIVTVPLPGYVSVVTVELPVVVYRALAVVLHVYVPGPLAFGILIVKVV